MGKEEKKLEGLENPFKEFSLLKGEFSNQDPVEPANDDIIAGDTTLIEEPDGLADYKTKLEKGDKALEQVIEKQKKAVKKKDPDPVAGDEPVGGDEPTEDTTLFKEFAKKLKEKNAIDFDDTDEDFEDSEDGISKLVEKTSEKRTVERINKWVESLPEEYVKMLEFVQNGGTPKEFLDTYYGNKSWSEFKIEDDEARKVAIKESLKLSGESDEDIKEILEGWELNGDLEKRAKSALVKLQKDEISKKEQLLKVQNEKVEREKQAQLEYWNNFRKDLYDKEDINGFKLTPKVKDNLWNFMTSVDKKTGKTPYQEAIDKNKDSQYLFAYLAMNNFDAKKLEKQVETKVASKFSAMVKNYANSSKNQISSGSSEEPRGENPFDAFKNLQ